MRQSLSSDSPCEPPLFPFGTGTSEQGVLVTDALRTHGPTAKGNGAARLQRAFNHGLYFND